MAETTEKAEASAEAPETPTPPEGGEVQQQEATQTEKGETTPEAPAGAPDEYSFSAPEGNSFDEQVLSAYSNVARELNLPNDQAQKIIDAVAPVIDQRLIDKVKEAHQGQIKQWADEAKKDTEIASGGFDENLAKAKQTFERIGSPDLAALLEELGLLNHKEVIRFGLRASEAVGEESAPVKGSPSQGEEATWADDFYGSVQTS